VLIENQDQLQGLKDHQAALKAKIARVKASNDPNKADSVNQSERWLKEVENEIQKLTKAK
jgi:hypothetical protein